MKGVKEAAQAGELAAGSDEEIVNRPAVVKGQPVSDCYIVNKDGFITCSKSRLKRKYNNIADYILQEDSWVWDMTRQNAELFRPMEFNMRFHQDEKTIILVHSEATLLPQKRYLFKLLYGKVYDISERLRRIP